ncbi:MAG: hypothetical protein ACTHMD_18025 [Flavisolibacter sp.]
MATAMPTDINCNPDDPVNGIFWLLRSISAFLFFLPAEIKKGTLVIEERVAMPRGTMPSLDSVKISLFAWLAPIIANDTSSQQNPSNGLLGFGFLKIA